MSNAKRGGEYLARIMERKLSGADENGAETDEPYIIGFAANIRANGKLYFVYHRTWKKATVWK